MKRKTYIGLGIVVLLVSAVLGYFVATSEICYAHAPLQKVGSVVLTTAEAQELYGVDYPMIVPMNKVSHYSCEKRWVLW